MLYLWTGGQLSLWRLTSELHFLSPFISFLVCTSFNLLTVGAQCYCCNLSHSVTHSVGLLWSRDRSDADISTCKHTTLTRDIHVPGGIRTRNPSKRSGAEPRLRPHRHWIGLSLLILSLTGCRAMHFSDINIPHRHRTLNQLNVV